MNGRAQRGGQREPTGWEGREEEKALLAERCAGETPPESARCLETGGPDSNTTPETPHRAHAQCPPGCGKHPPAVLQGARTAQNRWRPCALERPLRQTRVPGTLFRHLGSLFFVSTAVSYKTDPVSGRGGVRRWARERRELGMRLWRNLLFPSLPWGTWGAGGAAPRSVEVPAEKPQVQAANNMLRQNCLTSIKTDSLSLKPFKSWAPDGVETSDAKLLRGYLCAEGQRILLRKTLQAQDRREREKDGFDPPKMKGSRP